MMNLSFKTAALFSTFNLKGGLPVIYIYSLSLANHGMFKEEHAPLGIEACEIYSIPYIWDQIVELYIQ